MLGELVPVQGVPTDLFSQTQIKPQSTLLMSTMDSINRKMGKDSIKLASEGFRRAWKMKQENKTPSYTTSWSDLPVIV
jgi:DNA polymerase V